MPHTLDTLRTVPRLGLQNILRIVNYRLSLKNPYSAIRRVAKTGATITGPIFNIAAPDHSPPSPAQSARTYRDLEGTSGFTLPKAFGYHPVDTPQTTPDWFRNPLTRAEFKNPQRPFYEISDFDPDVGDIKQIWELSRKGWALDMARQAKHNPPLYPQLNDWISDWVRQNPAYEGPNWKCGQEASIRVMHLMVTGHLLGQLHSPTSGFLDYLKLHLRRIVPTISYAIAQDNNHGTSEAAALYMGGQYLVLHGENQGRHWSRLGRRLLENRIARLIAKDGSFSQYSITYHRMMLDSISYAEWWRRRISDAEFSPRFQRRMQAATTWLHRLIDPVSGDAPNIGANDGTHILNLSGGAYRDFRPSVALACALWLDKYAYENVATVRDTFDLLDLPLPSAMAKEPETDPGLNGGFAVIKSPRSMAVLRCPRFQFRPSQNDVLHVDFWHNGHNIFRDGGTYSYNSTPQDLEYFSGVTCHNTVQLDARNQMPRLGRFLLGRWPKTQNWQAGIQSFQAAYKDHMGAYHKRKVTLEPDQLIVHDTISGISDIAKWHWRLSPDMFSIHPDIQKTDTGISVAWDKYTLTIQSFHEIEAAWETGHESHYYLNKTPIPVLTATTRQSGEFTTILRWTL